MKNPLSYKDAGVDTEKAAALVGDIADLRTRTEGSRKLLQAFGLFAATYDLGGYKHPVILTGCDGVGTKLELLMKYDRLETAGVDLVAMNVNDILTANGLPIMFLDYLGVAQLDETLIKRLITGMADALAGCNCILAGGETAEMPGMVKEGTVELSGFCVGAAEKEDLLDPSTITEGDVVYGIPSNGIHANGFSLVRRILSDNANAFSDEDIKGLLDPTRIYYPEVKTLQEAQLRPKGMAHITGGGIRENLERVLGDHGADLKLPRWENPAVQKLISFITEETAVHTFNMGIGWMIIVSPGDEAALQAALPEAKKLGPVQGSTIEIEVPA